jgi:hypothetical protein
LLDIDSRQVSTAGREVILSNLEYRLLVVLASNPSRAFSKQPLMKKFTFVWHIPVPLAPLGKTVGLYIGLLDRLAGRGNTTVTTNRKNDRTPGLVRPADKGAQMTGPNCARRVRMAEIRFIPGENSPGPVRQKAELRH